MGAQADVFDKPWPGAGTGGSPALDFVNTLDWRGRTPPVETLHAFPDLVRWARTVGILDPAEAKALREWSEAHPRMAAGALADAMAVREAIAEIFAAVVSGERVPGGPLGQIDRACRASWEKRVLRPAGGGAMWDWRADGAPEPARPAMAVALDAARILTTDERERVRSCGDPECGWFFLDTSRNRSRRWCNMQSCGNRNKVRRFYQRHHG